MAIDRYVMAARTRMATLSTGADADETAEELRAHLEDAACELQLRGIEPRESEREAVRRFGASDDVAVALVAAHRRRVSGRRSLLAALVVAAITVLGSGVVASAHTPSPTAPTPPPTPTLTSIQAHATRLPLRAHAPLSPLMKGHRP